MIAIAAAAAWVAGACSGTANNGATSTSHMHSSGPTAVSVDETTSSVHTPASLPTVPFDPCTAIDDALLIQFGFDPSKWTRDEGSFGDEQIIACNSIGENRSLGVIAQNTPWGDIPYQVPPEPITVNGRESMFVPNSLSADSCSLTMRTDFGAVIIDTVPLRGGGADPDMHACDGIVEMAEAIEPLIEDGY